MLLVYVQHLPMGKLLSSPNCPQVAIIVVLVTENTISYLPLVLFCIRNVLHFVSTGVSTMFDHGTSQIFLVLSPNRWHPGNRALTPFSLCCRPVNMAPQMAQPAHSAGQMLAQMSRQNGAPQSVPPASTGSPLHGGPAGGWPGPGAVARPQFNNQVSLHIFVHPNSQIGFFYLMLKCILLYLFAILN